MGNLQQRNRMGRSGQRKRKILRRKSWKQRTRRSLILRFVSSVLRILHSSLSFQILIILLFIQDKYLRSVAEYRNLQERTKRDVQAARDFAITRFAKDLIESIDNLDRALAIVPESALRPSPASTTSPQDPNESDSEQSTPSSTESAASNQDLINLYDGLKMTERILMQTLAKHGLERFDPSEKGEKFDPNLHEATFQTPMEGKEDGTVMMTQQKGFLLNGRVVRVSSGSWSWVV